MIGLFSVRKGTSISFVHHVELILHIDAGRQYAHFTWHLLLCLHLNDDDGTSLIMICMRSTFTTFTRSVIYLIIMFSGSQQLSAVSAYGRRLWVI